MSDTRPARREQGFVHEHPALIAAVVGISITGIFLFALYQGMQGHQPPAAPGAAPAGSGAAHP